MSESFEKIPEGKVLKAIGVKRSEVTVIKRKGGLVILRKGVSLTDLLTGLLDSKKKRWEEKEYENYLLGRSS